MVDDLVSKVYLLECGVTAQVKMNDEYRDAEQTCKVDDLSEGLFVFSGLHNL